MYNSRVPILINRRMQCACKPRVIQCARIISMGVASCVWSRAFIPLGARSRARRKQARVFIREISPKIAARRIPFLNFVRYLRTRTDYVRASEDTHADESERGSKDAIIVSAGLDKMFR